MKSAGWSTCRPRTAASSSWLRSMLRYQLMPPANVPWCANDSTNTSRSASESQSSGPAARGGRRTNGRAVGSKKRYWSRGMSPDSAYSVGRSVRRRSASSSRLGDARLLEVEDVEEAVAQRGAHGVGGLRRRVGPARCPPQWTLRAATASEAVGPQQRGVPRHRAAPVVADDDGGVDRRARRAARRGRRRGAAACTPRPGRHVGGAVAALVGREHVVPGVAQRAQLVAPRVPALGEAVAEHDRAAVVGPGLGDVHADAVGVDVPMADHVSGHLSARRGRGRRSGRG